MTISHDIQELLYQNTRYINTKKRDKKPKCGRRVLSRYDDYEKHSDLSDRLEHTKGNRAGIAPHLKMTCHAKQRRHERSCKPGEMMYDVVKNNAIVTSFPIQKGTNTAMLKHMNHQVGALRRRTTTST